MTNHQMLISIPWNVVVVVVILFCANICHQVNAINEPNNNNNNNNKSPPKRSFTIDTQKQCFLLNGTECLQIISGSVHYPRIPAGYWEDRLVKAHAAGLNAIQTYVFWNVHQPTQGEFEFTGNGDIVRFLQTAQRIGLYVILRPGPYIDSEWDMGGLPWWLLKKDPHIKLRTMDQTYLDALREWYGVLLPKLAPLMYVNGGPILSVQVENEYGSYYACDKNYTAWLRDLIKYHLGNDVLLFTTDGNGDGYLKCGTIPGVYPTVDFGPQSSVDAVNASFQVQMKYAKKGPKVNSEYYPGWFDQWGDTQHHTVATNTTVVTARDILVTFNASINVYMFEGGTNFGYSAGAEGSDTAFHSITTSYDYDAALSEAGDPTPKYLALRTMFQNHHRATTRNSTYQLPPVPLPTPKVAYGAVRLKRVGSIFDELERISPFWFDSKYPKTAEQIDHGYGFILYSATLVHGGSTIEITHPNDRAIIIHNQTRTLGILQRGVNTTLKLDKPGVAAGDKLDILVENQGRICFGSWINDSKGIGSNVTLDGVPITDWKIYPITLEAYFSPQNVPRSTTLQHTRRYITTTKKTVRMSTQLTQFSGSSAGSFVPSIYAGFINTTKVEDTFFDATGWTKGQFLINGFNMGRYWPLNGPQQTLFVPKFYLKPGLSQVMLFEMEGVTNCQDDNQSVCFGNFVDKAKLDKGVRRVQGLRNEGDTVALDNENQHKRS